jgi:hypothetical protein
MTGSISKQIEAAKLTSSQAPAPWPTDQQPVAETPAVDTAIFAPSAMLSYPDAAAAGAASSPLDAVLAPRPGAYGADIGSASSIKTLQTRWTGLHSAHPQLFDGLHPSVTLRENARSRRTELRLVIGPLPNAEAAARLCTALAAFKQPCQPTMFDGRLALQ